MACKHRFYVAAFVELAQVCKLASIGKNVGGKRVQESFELLDASTTGHRFDAESSSKCACLSGQVGRPHLDQDRVPDHVNILYYQ